MWPWRNLVLVLLSQKFEVLTAVPLHFLGLAGTLSSGMKRRWEKSIFHDIHTPAGKYHTRNFTRKPALMRMSARLLTVLISSEELQSKSFQIPIPDDPTDPSESHPTPLHSSHKHLDPSLWKPTSFPTSLLHTTSCQMSYLSGNCWNFPDNFILKANWSSVTNMPTQFSGTDNVSIFHTLHTKSLTLPHRQVLLSEYFVNNVS